MPRRAEIQPRTVEPDSVYGSVLVTQLVNRVMLDGKKSIAEATVYDALAQVAEKSGKSALGDTRGVEPAADHLVAEPRQVLDAAAADQDDRVLLQVVPLAGDVRADLHLVRQLHAGDLAKRRVRLLRSRRVDARADAALLRCAAKRRSLDLRLRALTALADELVDGWHATPVESVEALSHRKGRQGRSPAARDREV